VTTRSVQNTQPGRPTVCPVFNFFHLYSLRRWATYPRVTKMEKKNPARWRPEVDFPNVRLDPESRLCSKYDAVSIKLFPMAQPGEMGMRVVDNGAEEHQM